MKKTASELILDFLSMSDRPLAIHEMRIAGVSQTSISARLRELRRQNRVTKYRAAGSRYDHWAAVPESDYNFNTVA